MIYYKFFKIRYLAFLLALMISFACSEDYPTNVESPNKSVLKSIKIVNAGPEGNTVIEGTVNENEKTVAFPRIDPETDFSSIKFEVQLSSGAELDQDTYAFNFEEGDSEKTIVVKVVNEKRYREYLVTIRQRVPVYGANFDNPTIYDHTNNDLGNPVYPTFQSLLTRGSGFDGENVLIVTRAEGGAHLLKYSDLQNDVTNPIPLNLTGVDGGVYNVSSGAIINGHVYIVNLAIGSNLRIYHWTDPEAAPDVIADIDLTSVSGAGSRYGDNMSVNIDKDGNGFMYFGDNAVTGVLRLTVTDFTNVSDPKVLPTQTGVTAYVSYNQVGETENYLLTGYEAPIMVADNSGGLSYTLSRSAVPIRGSDARVVTFNEERYLIMTTSARRGSDAVVLYVYDITKGDNIQEALDIFEGSDKTPLFKYSLLGPINPAPSSQTEWYVKEDEDGNDKTLVIYTASTDAGFVLLEFPKKEIED